MIGYRPLNSYDNINYRAVLDLADDSPFGIPRFEIGGASSLRGLEDFDVKGNARIFSNLEYIRGLRKYPAIRFSLFLDVGNVYDDLGAVDLTNLLYTVGVGMRWKLESFVETDLFIDYGYDVERGTGRLYGGTSLPF